MVTKKDGSPQRTCGKLAIVLGVRQVEIHNGSSLSETTRGSSDALRRDSEAGWGL